MPEVQTEIFSISNKRIWETTAIFFVIIFALLMRCSHLDFGLPQRLHPDEPTQIETALRIADGHLNPGFFRYPTGFMYLLASVFKIIQLSGYTSLAGFYLIGRFVSVLFGIATVYMVMKWSVRFWGSLAGFFAGIYISVLYTPIEQSHYAIVDVPMTFFLILTLYNLTLCWDAVDFKSCSRHLFISAVFCGIAISMKYTAALCLVPILFTSSAVSHKYTESIRHFSNKQLFVMFLMVTSFSLICGVAIAIRQESVLLWLRTFTGDGLIEKEYLQLFRKVIRLIIGVSTVSSIVLFLRRNNLDFSHPAINPLTLKIIAIIPIIFCLLSPYVFLSYKESFSDIVYEYRHMQIGNLAHYPVNELSDIPLPPTAAGSYLRNVFTETGGISFLAMMGISFFYWRGRWDFRRFIPSILFVLLYLITVCNWRYVAYRYLLPLYPIFAFWIGGAFSSGIILMKREPWLSKLSGILILVLTLSALHLSVLNTASSLKTLLLPETRELAGQWLVTQAPSGSKILRDDKAPDVVMLNKTYQVKTVSSSGYFDNATDQLTTNTSSFEYIISSVPIQSKDFQELIRFLPKTSKLKGDPIYISRRVSRNV